MEPRLSANLDLLRTVAVLLVLVQHLLSRFRGVLWSSGPDLPMGAFGVLLFFVHTCLVLMYSMQRSSMAGRPLAVNFYVRRIFRIYPLSILAVLTALALHLDSGVHGVPGLSRAAPVAIGRVVSNLLLVQNVVKPGSIINVLWSLPYEVQMYIFLPMLFMWVRGKHGAVRKLCGLWLAAVIVATVQGLVPYAGALSLFKRLTLLQFVPNFLPGIIAFALPNKPRISSGLWLPFILLLVAAYLLWPRDATGWVLCLILGCAIPFFEEIQSEWLRILSNRIATYSYGIYLSHQFCIWFVDDPLSSLSWWVKIPLLTGLLIGVPVVLYHGIERPMIRVGARLAERWSNGLREPIPVTS